MATDGDLPVDPPSNDPPADQVPPPPGGVSADNFKLLIPQDWGDFEHTHTQFVREWDKITGLR